jgi:hypothetical protein
MLRRQISPTVNIYNRKFNQVELKNNNHLAQSRIPLIDESIDEFLDLFQSHHSSIINVVRFCKKLSICCNLQSYRSQKTGDMLIGRADHPVRACSPAHQ